MKFFGIWDFCKGRHGGWICEANVVAEPPILVYQSKRKAQKRAADYFGFLTYTEAKRKGWCEVREFNPR